jgi:FAD/FMN-containing dehydrogenase
MIQTVTSWGRVLRNSQRVHEPAFADELPDLLAGQPPALAYGLGRSYGDICLNDGGSLIRMHHLDRILSADWSAGVIRAEGGSRLGGILRLAVPRGWFLPVTPGTKFVTLGGAVASDVHGKNHEVAGTFGCHVRKLALLRSNGEEIECGPDQNPALFAATVGGLGLTGIIVWVELQLIPIHSALFEVETTRLKSLDDFFSLSTQCSGWPYTVAWVDCLARGSSLGRGLFTRGRHATAGELTPHKAKALARVPVEAPRQLLNGGAVRTFNRLYEKLPRRSESRLIHYDAFLYPLDRIHDWNRLYGRAGFFQHQSVVPLSAAPDATRSLLELVAQEGDGSPLVVLKLFGNRPSPGLLSFPMEGATLAVDLPNRGAATRALLDRMTSIVVGAGGRIYPAKDATMSGEAFRSGFARWRELEAHRDPAFMSDFWRRVTRENA